MSGLVFDLYRMLTPILTGPRLLTCYHDELDTLLLMLPARDTRTVRNNMRSPADASTVPFTLAITYAPEEYDGMIRVMTTAWRRILTVALRCLASLRE